MEKAIEQAGDTEPARQARAWLDEVEANVPLGQWNKVDPPDNLDEVRAGAVEWIRQLMD